MNKEEIQELKDYHKRCIESIDNYYLSDSFYEIHNKVFKKIEELHNKIDKAIDVIHTQMKNNPSYKENLKIIENNLIKGSCKVCDLKDSDADE